jgi:hypothetical protein
VCDCHIGYVHLESLPLYDVFAGGVLERIPATLPATLPSVVPGIAPGVVSGAVPGTRAPLPLTAVPGRLSGTVSEG